MLHEGPKGGERSELFCPPKETRSLTLTGPAFFHISHGPGFLSHEASKGLVLNMTIVGYPLKEFFEVYNLSVAQNMTILETIILLHTQQQNILEKIHEVPAFRDFWFQRVIMKCGDLMYWHKNVLLLSM